MLDTKFLQEPVLRWVVFIGFVMLTIAAWAGVLRHMK